MDPVTTLKQAVSSTKTIMDFVEGGTLASTLADLGLLAAKDALEKARHATDSRSQVWSAINHLEDADTAINQVLLKRGKLLGYARPVRLDRLVGRLKYIRTLMAICYAYLGEKELARQTFWNCDQGLWGVYNENEFEAGLFGQLLRVSLWAANPVTYYDWTAASLVEGYELEGIDVMEIQEAAGRAYNLWPVAYNE